MEKKYRIRRRAESSLGVFERILSKYKGEIDFMWLGEDLGTQIAPMISLELYRKRIKPVHKMFVDLAKSYCLPVLVHTCGSSSWAYEDFIETGALAYGSVRDVEEVCKRTLEIMMPTRGYHFAPTHDIQDNTPVENVIAMYQAAHDYGRFS